MIIFAMLIASLYLLLIGLRAYGASRFFALAAHLPPPQALADQVTVLQPILSGDPTLMACLEANLRAHPHTAFLWLVDEDDPVAQTCAGQLAPLGRVKILVGPPPSGGENPKVAKLARAFSQVVTPFCAVLDDDTVLPPGSLDRAATALSKGGIACGLPLYVNTSSPWSRLVTGFVNGASLITYPTAAYFGASRTLNGMFYVVRTEELRDLGGFEPLVPALTDDYAIARLYLDNGRAILQTDIVHPISTSVPDVGAYTALMHRWMIFANHYVAENRSLFTLGLIGASTLLPLLLLLAAIILASVPIALLTLAVLAAKARVTANLRRRFTDSQITAGDVIYEMVADLLTPLHVVRALALPHVFMWRRRAITLRKDRIDYR